MSVKSDMDLSEFVQLSNARQVPDSSDWIVSFKAFDGSTINLTVGGCLSEFEAKENTYHYLLDKIHNKA